MENRKPTSVVKKKPSKTKRNAKKIPRKDAPQLALSIVERVTGGKLKNP